MSEEKEMTAPNVSIGVDTEQSSIKQTTNSISNRDVNFNPFDEFFKKIDPSYMKTVTMQELYQDIYSKKPPVIEGLLYQGTYLFVGSPKIGKSFFMAQLAYYVSTGTPLWDYPVKRVRFSTLHWKDDYRRFAGTNVPNVRNGQYGKLVLFRIVQTAWKWSDRSAEWFYPRTP